MLLLLSNFYNANTGPFTSPLNCYLATVGEISDRSNAICTAVSVCRCPPALREAIQRAQLPRRAGAAARADDEAGAADAAGAAAAPRWGGVPVGPGEF